MKPPLKIGLTGGIGSGKSTVAKMFEVLNIPVLYADMVAKNLMHTDPILRERLIEAFGAETYQENKLNSAYLSSVVFKDNKQLQRLNAIVHPATIAEAERWFIQQTASYVIKEAALLFESGSASGLDYIIGVSTPLTIRIQRTVKRDKVSEEQVLQRINKQIDETIKMKLCNFVLMNDEQQMLLPQILKLHEHLLNIALT